MKKKKPSVQTIADIAEMAGVSKSTVSRALNDSPLISRETKDRIRAIAEEHRFETHQGARNLSLRRSQTIGLLVPIDPEAGYYVTDPFLIELLGSIAKTLAEYNYDLLVTQVRLDDRTWVQRYIGAKRVDGLIVPVCGTHRKDVDWMADHGAPFIAWGEASAQQRYCSVTSDDITGGRLATEHLLDIGRRRIAFLGGTEGEPEAMHRYLGYQEALKTAGIPFDPELVAFDNYSGSSGYRTMQALMERHPDLDAAFANSDVMAIAAMEAVREAGKTVPDDISVVGYDGIPLASHCSPPLTTIRQEITKAGELLVRQLIQFLETGVVTATVLPVELIVRKSSDPQA